MAGVYNRSKKIPVILDTDIGTDIDDTWALALLLNCPELDLKLVVSETGDTLYRAKLLCKLLETAGRADVPVGIGIPLESALKSQKDWIRDYSLESYPGKIFTDGVGAIMDCIMASPQPVTLISIGPVVNIAAALDREPGIVKNARFVGMQGSLREGYTREKGVSAEYNVVKYPYACQKVFSASWDMTITPLDSCGKVQLKDNHYRQIRNCNNRLTRAVIENYDLWAQYPDWAGQYQPDELSSTLYDTVAVYLAFSRDLLVMEQLKLKVTDDGFTVMNEQGKSISCATGWKNLAGFNQFLVERLTGDYAKNGQHEF